MRKRIKTVCNTCNFSLTSGDAEVGDICPWCHKGTLANPDH